jgi:hypothetical protein
VIAPLVYFLCAATSIACSILLLRAYRRSAFRLLLWSSVCFALLALNNVLLFVDLILVPEVDLLLWRNLAALAGVSTLLFGLIWNTE